jgi:hypothetical protein
VRRTLVLPPGLFPQPARPTPTYPEYAQLHADAQAETGQFVDPVKVRAWQALPRGRDWKMAVLGHDLAVSQVEMHMLLLAHARNLDPPLPQWLVDQRAARAATAAAEAAAYEAREAGLWAEWKALADKLPVPVALAYNYSGPNHLEMWCQGAVHVLVREPLSVGRLSRPVGYALCSVPSNQGSQLFAHQDEPHDRRPTCKTCIRIACRLTRLEAPLLLSGGTRRGT